MDFRPDVLGIFIQEVERQGGAQLPDPCMPQDCKYEAPPYNSASIQRGITTGCGHNARIVHVYDPQDEDAQSGSGFATVCAICDAAGAWPRYEQAVRAADSKYWDDIAETEEDEDAPAD